VHARFEVRKRCTAHTAAIKEDVEHNIHRYALSTKGKPMAILSMLPVFMSMTLMPEAIPLFSGGTEDMMALVLGEAKRPEPPPLRIM